MTDKQYSICLTKVESPKVVFKCSECEHVAEWEDEAREHYVDQHLDLRTADVPSLDGEVLWIPDEETFDLLRSVKYEGQEHNNRAGWEGPDWYWLRLVSSNGLFLEEAGLSLLESEVWEQGIQIRKEERMLDKKRKGLEVLKNEVASLLDDPRRAE